MSRLHKDDARILGFIVISFCLAGIGGVMLAVILVYLAGK